MSSSKRSAINIFSLKQFAFERLDRQSALRDVLLDEKDEISAAELILKIRIWLALLRREGKIR